MEIVEVVAAEAEMDLILHNKVVEVIYEMRRTREATAVTVMKSYKIHMGNHNLTSNGLDIISLDIIVIIFHT